VSAAPIASPSRATRALAVEPKTFPVYIDCSKYYAHRDTKCDDVFVTDSMGNRIRSGVEVL
jgi:hypothetical protein